VLCHAVQTLLNDCKDLDPTIRGLAVRSMCSLRVPELMENVVRTPALLFLLEELLGGLTFWFELGVRRSCLPVLTAGSARLLPRTGLQAFPHSCLLCCPAHACLMLTLWLYYCLTRRPPANPPALPPACLQFQAVDAGLRDAHPYVREAAVMGVLKCFHQDPAGWEGCAGRVGGAGRGGLGMWVGGWPAGWLAAEGLAGILPDAGCGCVY